MSETAPISEGQRRWEAMVDAETDALRAEFEARYAGMSGQDISECAAAAIRKYGGGS